MIDLIFGKIHRMETKEDKNGDKTSPVEKKIKI